MPVPHIGPHCPTSLVRSFTYAPVACMQMTDSPAALSCDSLQLKLTVVVTSMLSLTQIEPSAILLVSFWRHDLKQRRQAVCCAREIQAHIAEDFWHIQVTHTGDDHKRCDFSWERGRLFDHTAATVLYEMCVEEPQATVTKASTTPPCCVPLQSQRRTYCSSNKACCKCATYDQGMNISCSFSKTFCHSQHRLHARSQRQCCTRCSNLPLLGGRRTHATYLTV